MTAFAVLRGECDAPVASAAIFALPHGFHCNFVVSIAENCGVATITTHQCDVGRMREICLKFWFVILQVKVQAKPLHASIQRMQCPWFDDPVLLRLYPVRIAITVFGQEFDRLFPDENVLDRRSVYFKVMRMNKQSAVDA